MRHGRSVARRIARASTTTPMSHTKLQVTTPTLSVGQELTRSISMPDEGAAAAQVLAAASLARTAAGRRCLVSGLAREERGQVLDDVERDVEVLVIVVSARGGPHQEGLQRDLAVAERSYIVAQHAEAPDVRLSVRVEVCERTDLAGALTAPLDIRRHPAHVRVA